MSQASTSTPTCPQCNRAMDREDVNVAKDVAYCRRCNLAHSLSELVRDNSLFEGVDFNNPPDGITFRQDGAGVLVSASMRSVGGAIGALAVSLFWNGIVSVFVLLAFAGTLANLGIAVPGWFPAPEMNDAPMGVGMTVFLWLFLTPFIIVGAAMIGTFFFYAAGGVDIRIERNEGSVFSGIGPAGITRRFRASEITDVRIDDKHWMSRPNDNETKMAVCIETREGKIIRFGSMLPEERRRFVAAVLRRALIA